jgi:hypothetical protein
LKGYFEQNKFFLEKADRYKIKLGHDPDPNPELKTGKVRYGQKNGRYSTLPKCQLTSVTKYTKNLF